MPRVVSATEAKNRLGALIGWVLEQRATVIVESRGKPQVVVMTYAEYENVKAIQEELRRREVLAKLEGLRDAVRSRNRDLAPAEAEAVADRLVREVVGGMVAEGKVRFAG